jgi:hypothetical protein
MTKRARHIGIVAVSAEGAALCYRTICAEGADLVGPHDHPQVTMHTYPLAEYMRPVEAKRACFVRAHQCPIRNPYLNTALEAAIPAHDPADASGAEVAFREAIAIARRQHARSWELRGDESRPPSQRTRGAG